jgi:polyhydroxybutyrate depolymerase
MMKRRAFLLFSAFALWATTTQAAEPQRREWDVQGVKREALLYVPTKVSEQGMPVVFGFHGHGGNMRNAARSFRLHEVWPEALVVYMQGLSTPGRLTDPDGKKSGWQGSAGDQEDRDLQFFDAVLATLKSDFKIDPQRIYSTGHSNGGGFTYLLWAERGDVFAAVAPSASLSTRELRKFKPKPVLHLAGEKDPLVKFAWQEAFLKRVVEINGCGSPVTWSVDDRCTLYPSVQGTPVITALHPGGHEYHRDAPELIVKFFKQFPKASTDK